jgi:tRNA A-37 threonylcarbamoyl transferase component Bud32
MRDVLAPGTRLGPFEIDTLIGAGGMGQVYRAHDPRLGRRVAIKTLSGPEAADTDRVRRFETEAKAVGSLDHPNLLVVYDVGRQDGVSYIVSELLEGETLRERLREGPVPERHAVDYAAQIARGLAAAHARGIVHRDLKPENLFITGERRVKILDFGVAKLTRAPEADDPTVVADALTGEGVAVGTVGYMAPEQVRGDAIDQRADIFALGLVTHEMLSGARPFRRDTVPETLTAILKDDPPDLPSSVTPALANVVRRCLEKRPDDRFHSAHDLGLALDLLATTTSVGTVPVVDRPVGVPRRKALLYGASSLVLLASGMAGGVLLDRQLRPTLPASFRRLTFRRGLIRSARVAPDGQTILYGALWDDGGCRVHTVRSDGPESSPLELPDANLLAISSTGELAVALGSQRLGVITYGTLARVSLAGGVPRPMVEDVKFADWSADGADLAIVRLVDGRDRLEFPVGRALVAPAVGEPTGLGFARISPDGRHVAFVHYTHPSALTGRVSIVDQAGTVTPLSDESLNIHGLAWKGDEIWYTAADDRPLFRALCAVAPAGGATRTVARMPGNATLWDTWPDGRLLLAHTDDHAVMAAHVSGETSGRALSWFDESWPADLSRDGRQLLFTEAGQGGGSEAAVYLRGTEGSAAVRLGAGRALALSPDGRWALSAQFGYPASHLELLPTGAGEPRRLPTHGLAYLGAGWIDDRRIIAWALEQGRLPRLYVLDLAQGGPQPVTPEGIQAWVASPEGSIVAALGPDPLIRLYSLDGSVSRELPGTTGRDVPVGWIRDGLLVTRPSDPASPLGDIYRVDVTTGHREFWSNVLPSDRSGIMGLNGFAVTPDGRSWAYAWHRALSSLYVASGLS